MRSTFPLLLVLFVAGLLRALSLPAVDCEVSPDASWKSSLDFPEDPFTVTHDETKLRWVKFTILTCDPPRVYFQNSRKFPFHHDFAAAHLDPFLGMSPEDFDAVTLHLDAQVAVLGAVILAPTDRASVSEFGVQFVGKDPYPAETVVELFHAVTASVNDEGARAYYFPTFEQMAAAQQDAVFLAHKGVLLGSSDRWSEDNAIYAEGWALGRLRFFPVPEIRPAYESGALRPDDILLTDGVPAEVPFVAGILSLAPGTPNSHVAILARNYGVPLVYLSVPADAARARDLAGKTVILAAFETFSGSDFRLLDVDGKLDEETVAEILALREPPALELTPIATAPSYSMPVVELGPADIGLVGGKAANYGLLSRSIPTNSRTAVAFTFKLWTDFLSQQIGNGRTLREEIDARLAPHCSYPPADVGALASVLAAVRDLFENPAETTFDPALCAAVIETLQDSRYAFDPVKRIRVRSSTNFEDSEQFTGAGLFDSRSGCLLDDLDDDDDGPSHCDATKLLERGIFRAIRHVFASFYNDNAYLERRRRGVDESQVGMGLLVHHSFPDETELANGVATLTPSGPNYIVKMVTQDGATSVTNPEGGSIPETMNVWVYDTQTYVDLVSESNLVPLGATVLEWPQEYQSFAGLFIDAAKAFEKATGKTQYILDFEYKKIAPGDQLAVKQIRQLPLEDRKQSITPFLLDVPMTFTTFQGEAADLFSNHLLKSTWTFQTESMWLSEENLGGGIFRRLAVDYSDGCDVLHFEGDVSSLPLVKQSHGEDQFVRLRWSFEELANSRAHELFAGPLGRLVSPSESPFVTLADLQLGVSVTHQRPVLGWDGLEGDTRPTTEQYIALAVEPTPADGDLEQVRSVTRDGVTVTTRFYWPPPPRGIIAGYTAPLLRWIDTVIEGLTGEPIVLLGDRSQTYRPGHHNFSEDFLFAPHQEEGIDPGLLAELDLQDIRWIHMFVGDAGGNAGGRLEFHDSCKLALECACRIIDPPFRRGDCNDDGSVDISDAAFVLGWLFLGSPEPGCVASTNVNGDAGVDIADPTSMLNFLFLGGAAPLQPFPDCGPGSLAVDEELGCGIAPAACP